MTKLPSPRFSHDELWVMEEDARAAFLNEDGALNEPGKWLGNQIDLCRFARTILNDLDVERDRRLHG